MSTEQRGGLPPPRKRCGSCRWKVPPGGGEGECWRLPWDHSGKRDQVEADTEPCGLFEFRITPPPPLPGSCADCVFAVGDVCNGEPPDSHGRRGKIADPSQTCGVFDGETADAESDPVEEPVGEPDTGGHDELPGDVPHVGDGSEPKGG